MIKRTHPKLALLCFFILFSAKLQAQQYNFKNYSVREGVAQSQVYSLIQDSRGYLWMGTRGGGITRFDGVNFKTYTQKDGLNNNYVFCISEDAKHNLWIGTNNGLAHFNGIKYTKYLTQENPQLWILDIAFDKKGRKWLATNQGVLFMENDSARNISLELNDPVTMINTIYADEKGQIWYGNAMGLSRITETGKGFMQEKLYRTKNLRVPVNAISQDSQGSLWIGTYNAGLYVYAHDSFSRIGHFPELDKQSVFDIYFDRNGNAWLATLNKGVAQYHINSSTLSWLGENEGLSNNHVRSILQDKSGNYWFGTSGGGACHYFGKQFTTYDKSSGLGGNFVYSIFRDSRKRLLIGTSDKGLTVLDSGKFKTYNAINGFYDIKIKAISEDLYGNVYLGTEANGLFMYNDSGFFAVPGFSKKYVRAIARDKDGNLYVAASGTGIYKIKKSGGDSGITQFTMSDGLLSNRISCLHYDKKGQIWYGTENHGVGVLINDKPAGSIFNAKNGLPSNAVRCFTEDRNGNLWIGTAGNGLASIPLYQGEYKVIPFNRQNELTSLNIYLLTTDGKDFLYAGTETGLDRISLDPSERNGIRHFGKGEGFTGIETCQNAVFNDSNGTIWFGTINGLTKYIPADKYRNENAPVTSITDVRLFYEPVSTTSYKTYVGDWNTIAPLVLPYDQNHLTFDFQGINFSNPDAVSYQWKLEGFDPDWSPVSRQRTVTYSNLPHGEYTFMVKACNEDGVWNSAPQTFHFSITPPFWKLWWVIASFIATLALVIVLLFRWRIRSIRKKAAEAQNKIQLEKEVLELEQKALRLQMNPHFIFNALNSIQSQIGTDNEQAARYYLAKFSRLMRQILDNSRNSVITLREEINTLENYLLIEKFCNGDRFDYVIHVEPHIDTDYVTTPPMLLQPFIENSIKHGLKFMDGRRGMITIDIKEKDHILECSVTDNGIGRVKAAELSKASKETYHESVALKVTEERLNLLKTDQPLKPLEIIDLYDENGKAAGTKVIIRISV